MNGPQHGSPDLLRLLSRHRRLLAAGLVALAVLTALPVLAPSSAAGVPVLAAARDLPSGAVVTPTSLVVVELPATAVPSGALSREDAEGRVLAGPVRRGEPLTDVRLVGPALLADAGPDLVATPVRLADPASALLLRTGDVVDVLAAATSGDGPAFAAVVAASARVVAVPQPGEGAADAVGSAEGALVVVAVPQRTAARLAASAVSSRLSVVLRA